MKSTLFAALVPLLLMSTGCETPIGGCTEIGCSDSLNMNVYLNLIPESEYRVEMDTGEGISECSFYVNELGELEGMMCDDPEAEIYSDLAAASALTAPAPRQEPMPTPNLVITLRRGDIDLLDFTLYQDDVESFAREISPSYEELTPNGDRCPPVCRVATVDLFI